MSYHPLQRIDEVLQVDVVSVCFDVCQEEFVDPLSDLTLKNHRQHRCRQLQDEDEADHAGKLTEKNTSTSLTYKKKYSKMFLNFTETLLTSKC